MKRKGLLKKSIRPMRKRFDPGKLIDFYNMPDGYTFVERASRRRVFSLPDTIGRTLEIINR